jgi:hypothetical protein
MDVAYSESQKAVLIEEVSLLCRVLGRPVCSKDLLDRWREKPDRRPLLAQAPGQLLIKATRPCKFGHPVLFRVGVIGNLVFYAADQSPRWAEALRRHEIELRAKVHARWGIPEQAVFLLGTEFEASARNALAGFVAEWGPIAADKSIVLPERLHELLETARSENPGEFRGQCPELIGRGEAMGVILDELAVRSPFPSIDINWNRYLAALRWPMSSLFTQAGFWEEQVRLYCAARWPIEEDPMESKARWLCGVYGHS